MAVSSGTVQVVMPAMGDSVAEGTVLEWHKQEGDTIEVDETLVEISTDKVDAELPAPAGGTITEILFAEGDTVSVGQVIARMQPSADGAPTSAPAPAPESGASTTAGDGGAAANISPVARRIAAQQGVDLSALSGSA